MSEWKGKKVLVTGADGFIGSHLTEALIYEGADVTALTLYNSFDSHGWLDEVEEETQDAIRMVRGDIRDPQQMMHLAKGQEVVFHLAALIAIPFSYDAPTSYVQTNVQGTTNVLMAALQAGCARIIHTSTSEVYGTALFTPINESHPLQGQSPYAASKIGADMVAQSFHRSFDLPVVMLRPFNTYGPRQSERAVISTAIRQALDDRCEAVELGDLTPTRDFNYVTDTVSAFLSVASLSDGFTGNVFNAGSGKMVSVGDMVEAILAITKCKKPVLKVADRTRPAKSEVLTLMADSTRLTEVSGWHPKYDFNTGLEETVNWWKGQINGVRSSTKYAK